MLPLNLVVFTTPKGHFGNSDVYKTSIKHLAKKLGGLDVFGQKFAHIKVRNNEEERSKLPEMLEFFGNYNIKPIVTYGDWERGMSHQNEYLKDIYKMFSMEEVNYEPYTFWFEDDSPIKINTSLTNLKALFELAITTLHRNPDVLNVRFIREGINDIPKLSELYSVAETFDFQPNISRTRDLFLASKIIFDNWDYFKNVQCEMAFRLAISNFSRTNTKFLGFNPEIAQSYHIGTPEYPKYLETEDFKEI